mgnify:CR=1 FL=1
MKDTKIPETLALCSAAAFVLTALYVKAYSLTFGVRLNPYFSLGDYTRFAIDWLPLICLLAVLGILLEKFCARVERGASETELAMASGFPKFVGWFRRSAEWIPLLVISGLAVVTTRMAFLGKIPAEHAYKQWAAAGTIIWFALVAWYSREKSMIAHWPHMWFRFVMFFPAMVIGATFWGFAGGVSKTNNLPKTQVYIKSETPPLEGRLMFVLDNFVLIQVEDSRRFIVIARDQVTMMVAPEKEHMLFPSKKDSPSAK